ncbi:unnamed protein product [Adineta steineri]|uniref:Uncharacterized protein n=1 Tax=Adineta steineri TaxID=433720 RepID=A0A819KMR6_9BILA|nr:unnamed protein product [Adineta steineri]
MYSIISILIFILFYNITVSSECESNATLWTYYPCSFIITPISFNCQHITINSSIDQCTNREMTFFWHFPFGNMTLTLQSDQNRPFLLRLSKPSLSSNKLIKNIYHLVHNKTSEEQLVFNNDGNAIITLYSDRYSQCSMKFETINPNLFDYGTFIRMTVSTDPSKNL